jgi:adenosylhomocysteinase
MSRAKVNVKDFEKQGVFAQATAFYPLLEAVGDYLVKRGTLRDVRLAWHCHLTALTAISAKALKAGGCRVTLSECNPATSDDDAIAYMTEELGFETYTGAISVQQVLKNGADVISDTGFDLLSHWLSEDGGHGNEKFSGACEITTSGITRLRELESVPIPIININDGQIKSFVENFHGVGDGVIEAVKVLTGRSFQGERACVVGYGRVGAGVAHYLSRNGIQVTVVENDAVRRLVAHFDGFPLASLHDAMRNSALMVTATGIKNLLRADDWKHARDGLLSINVGHWRDEIGFDELHKASKSSTQISEHIDEFHIDSHDGKPLRIRIATKGDPCNVTLLTGSIEPTLLHLAVEILSLDYLVSHHGHLKPGEMRVPESVERTAAELALQVSIHRS